MKTVLSQNSVLCTDIHIIQVSPMLQIEWHQLKGKNQYTKLTALHTFPSLYSAISVLINNSLHRGRFSES